MVLPTLHAAQREIKDHPARFKVVNCGRRFGKDILSIDLLIHPALAGYPVAWFQPSYKSMLEVWRMMKRVLRPITTHTSEQDKRIDLVTGGTIDFWSLDGDPEGCRGRKYKRVVINEAAKVRHLQTAWELAIRPTLTDYKGDAVFPSTPRGRDYYWELFNRSGDPEKWPGWHSWKNPTSDNPLIDKTEIEAARRELPTTVYLQEYEAEFLDVAGKFFDEWEPERKWLDFDEATREYVERKADWHQCTPFPIPNHWRFWAGLDYGTTPTHKTFAFVLLTIDEHGNIYIVDEVYGAGWEAPEQIPEVLECLRRNHLADPVKPDDKAGEWKISPRFEGIQWDWANTFPPTGRGAEQARQRQGKYPVEYYWEKGLASIEGVKDRIAGWREVRTFMHKIRTFRSAETGEEDVLPILRAFKGRCSDTIRTLSILVRSDEVPEDIAGGNKRGGEKKQEDHLADALRMSLMTRPKPSDPLHRDKPKRDEYEEMAEKAASRNHRKL